MTEPQLGGNYEELLRAARFAESAGLVSFARSDHWHWEGTPREATDAFATIAGLARDTETIRLCILVSPITFRHPAVIAKNAATIDQMSGGRLDLGIGTGWNEYEHEVLGLEFPGWEERYERLGEAVAYLRAAFTGERFAGSFYRLEAAVLPRPESLRLVIGGTGPERTPRFAGIYGDEYNLIMTHPESAATRVARMREAADGRAVEATVMGQVFAARTDDEFQGILSRHAARRGLSTDEMTRTWEREGKLFGTPGRIADQVAALEEAGIERIYLQWLDLTDFAGMERMVEAVLSA